MKNILLLGSFAKETFEIERKLRELDRDIKVEVVMEVDDMIKKLRQSQYALLVYNIGQFKKASLDTVEQIKSFSDQTPLIVLAKVIDTKLLSTFESLVAVVLLEKPFEDKDLQGIANKFLSEIDVCQRFYRRFYTNQKAEVELFGSGESIHGRVLNLSKGGAYFETHDVRRFSVGDLLSLRIVLRELSREYHVTARVVWATDAGMWTGGYGVGVKFVKADDVYSKLFGS